MVQVTLVFIFLIGNDSDSGNEQHTEDECQVLMGESREMSNDKVEEDEMNGQEDIQDRRKDMNYEENVYDWNNEDDINEEDRAQERREQRSYEQYEEETMDEEDKEEREGESVRDSDDAEEDNDIENEELVMIALRTASTLSTDTDIDPTVADVNESELVSDFMAKGCGCHSQCLSLLSEEHVTDVRAHCASLTHDELDLVILEQLMALSNCSDVVSTTSRHSPKERKKYYSRYFHSGHQITPKVFRFLHTIGEMYLKNLIRHYNVDGPHHEFMTTEIVSQNMLFLFPLLSM